MIFSDNKYVFWRLACDVLSSKTKLVNDSEIKYNTKKKALDHCKKLIEQGFYEKKIQFAHRRLFKNKNLRIEKWIKYKANNDVLPSKKMEKIGEFKYA